MLWLRQIKRYFRSKSRIIGSLGQPVLFLVSLGFGLSSVFQASGNGNYIQFLVPGIVAMTILFSAMFSGIEIIWDRQFGFLKETLVAPVPRTVVMFGRTLGGATTSVLQGTLLLVISLFFGFHLPLFAILPAFVIMVLISLIFTALGTAIASILEDMQGFQLIMNFVIMPIFFLSGALFPLESAPSVLKLVASFNPLTYGVDGLRAALLGVSVHTVWTDVTVLLAVGVAFIILGGWLFNRIQA